MTSSGGIENRFDPLDVEAADWVVRLTVGRLTEMDRQSFGRWLSASAAHERAFAAASDLCAELRSIPLSAEDMRFVHGDPAVSDNVVPFVARTPRRGISRRGFLGGGAIAASLAGAFAIVRPPLGLWPSLAELMADQSTGAGERRSFTPIAGVNIELNSRSSASSRDGGNGLALIQGEAFVTVAARERAFEVRAADGIITARDASFNVQSLDDSLCVTCVRGSVTTVRGGREQTLAAGREIAFAADGAVREAQADEMVRLAWRHGLLILRKEPVAAAIPQINRYFPGRLVLTDTSKSNWPVSGVFHVNQIELAVVQLERLLDVKATRLPGGVVLLG